MNDKEHKKFGIVLLEHIIKILDFIPEKYQINIIGILKNLLLYLKNKIIIVAEETWAIQMVGYYVSKNLKNLGVNIEITSPFYASNKIIHFGSINTFLYYYKIRNFKNSNKIIVTWFHIVENDKRMDIIPLIKKKVDILHVSNDITKQQLIGYGINEKKIIKIPLGFDHLYFRKNNDVDIKKLKKKFGLPLDKIIIGSFQKDGVGWGEGIEPKLVKGPDIFCETINMLKNKFEIHVFLTGPARGFVKNKLKEYGIPFTHIFLKNYLDIVDCYNVLDLYIISSRSEGGPLALLEGMAIGVPIVSTKVGMAPEIIKHGYNGFLADIDDVEQLCRLSTTILKDNDLRNMFIRNGYNVIKRYNWKEIANQYYNKIYSQFL